MTDKNKADQTASHQNTHSNDTSNWIEEVEAYRDFDASIEPCTSTHTDEPYIRWTAESLMANAKANGITRLGIGKKSASTTSATSSHTHTESPLVS